MFKRLIGIGLVALLSAGSAHAANCSAYTYTLTNGTTADANQVMNNFNNILNCGNNNLAPLASQHFTGNVGINISSPAAKLAVQSTVTLNNDSTYAIHAVDGVNASKHLVLGYDDTSNAGVVASVYTGFSWTNTLINPIGGNVGIGTASPTLLLYVNGTAGGTSAYQNVSDARLKKNVQPISGGLEMVKRLNPVSYDWRAPAERGVGKALNLATGERQIGFIAQEVEKVVPEAVSKPKSTSDVYSLKQDNLIPVLVAAIKEQQAEIEQLRATVAALTPATQH